MHGRQKLRDLRAAIRDIIQLEAREAPDGKTSNEQILTRLQRDRPKLIDEFRSTLFLIGLTKILNDECQKVPQLEGSGGQSGLFAEAEQMTFLLSLGNGNKQNVLDVPMNQIIDRLTKKGSSKKTAKDRVLEWLEPFKNFSETGEESPRELITKAKKGERH
jgi:hypothetical protein